jgi:hypothetical protein
LIRHEEELFVGGKRQATRLIELAGLVTPLTHDVQPIALYLGARNETQTHTH